ncbi:MAG: trigger factor, partial [Bacteroidales bacterium]
VKDCGIKVEHDDLVEMAKKATKMQFAQYGMANVPDDLLQKYTDDMLKDKKVTSNMADRVIEDKLVAAMKDMVTLNRKNISLEDFYKSIESK